MDDIAVVARERAERLGVEHVVVSTNTGASALHVREVFGDGYVVIGVGNPQSSHDRGLVRHSGLSEETRRQLQSNGIEVVLRDQSFVQNMHFGDEPMELGGKSYHLAKPFERSGLAQVIEEANPTGASSPMAVIANVLNWFGDGVRVCFEVCLMAADAGVLPVHVDCVAIARPGPASNCPHAAVVLRPAKTEDVFKGSLRVKDIALVPGDNDHWFSNEPLWQG